MSIVVKRLVDNQSIEKYIQRFEELVGVRMPKEYLTRGIIYGCHNKVGELVGGYTLINMPPYRGVVFLPDDIRRNHWFFRTVSMNHMLEVNGVWLEPTVRFTASGWFTFWRHVVRAVGRTGKRYVLVWYNNRNRHLHRFYSRVMKEQVYTGPSAPNGNERTHPEICVAYTTHMKLYWSLARLVPKILRIRVAKFLRGLTNDRRNGNCRRTAQERA